MPETLKYISLFSGIGGFDLGFDHAGMQCVLQVENDRHCLDVLTHHWPDVSKIKDVRDVTGVDIGTVDLVCGGFPCQDVSIAGRRKGLAGSQSGLWFEFHRVLSEIRPRWVVIENVPGLLSSNSGRDFAVILSGLGQCGYLSVWRILDSQYFGVPQRRRRVFIVGHLGVGGGCAAQVLFESKSMSRYTRQGKKTGQITSLFIETGVGAGRTENDMIYHENKSSSVSANNTARSLRAGASHSYQMVTHALSAPKSATGRLDPTAVTYIPSPSGVRRFTPTECERLQGFPDGWTAGQSDSVRYRQLGNAVTVNVAEWIGRRIIQAELNRQGLIKDEKNMDRDG